MRIRERELGNRNIVGKKVEQERKRQKMKQKELLAQLQIKGIDISASGLSKLEGQVRLVTDKELLGIAQVLNISIDNLLGVQKRGKKNKK